MICWRCDKAIDTDARCADAVGLICLFCSNDIANRPCPETMIEGEREGEVLHWMGRIPRPMHMLATTFVGRISALTGMPSPVIYASIQKARADYSRQNNAWIIMVCQLARAAVTYRPRVTLTNFSDAALVYEVRRAFRDQYDTRGEAIAEELLRRLNDARAELKRMREPVTPTIEDQIDQVRSLAQLADVLQD